MNQSSMKARYALIALPLCFGAPLLAASCAGTESVTDEGTSDDEAALARSEAISRAEQWVAAKLHYCQAPAGARDYDAACSTYCNRTRNPAWDPYRSDCSGLISWAWGLPAPGRVTWQFAPFDTGVSSSINAIDLQPGDAVNNDEHVMLFKAWVTKGQSAVFIEEPGCSSSTPYAHELTTSVSISGSSIHVSWNGMTFTAIRYKGISGSGSAPPPPAQPKLGQRWLTGDFDGDGRLDYAKYWDDDGQMTADAHLSSGSAFSMRRFATRQGGFSDDQRWVSGDFDGDGKTDLAKYWDDGGQMSADVHLSSGSAFSMHRFATKQGGYATSQRWFTGDFDGDGKTDLAKFWNDGGEMSADVHVSSGASFAMHRFATKQGGYSSAQQWFSGDFDGDGRADFAKIWDDGGEMSGDVHLSDGKTFAMHRWATQQGGYSTSQKWFAADFDGDGKTDLAKYWNDGGQWTVDVHLSTGSGFKMQRWATKQGGYSAAQRWFVGDLDGDGKADFAKVWNDAGQMSGDAHLSSGTSFAMHRWATKQGGFTDDQRWTVGDFTGGGRADFSKYWDDGGRWSSDVHVSSGASVSMQRWATKEGGYW